MQSDAYEYFGKPPAQTNHLKHVNLSKKSKSVDDACQSELNHSIFSFSLSLSMSLSLPVSLSCADHRTHRPPLVPGYPENTTAVVGGNVKLVCKVHKPASTRIQWLRKDDSVLGADNQPHLRALTVQEHSSTQLHLLTETFF